MPGREYDEAQQLRNVDRAGQDWTDAARQSFQALSDQTVRLQESNLRLTKNFFQQFVEQLQNQTEGNRQATQTLQQQGQRQQQAFETLAQETANAYSDFLNSALSFYQQTLQQATEVAQSNMQRTGQVAQQGIEASSQAAQAAQQAIQALGQAAQQQQEEGVRPESGVAEPPLQKPEDPNQTGAERGYSHPSSGPLIGRSHDPERGDVPVQHEELENRIRTRIGEDPRTSDLQHLNVEVNDDVADIRGVAPSQDAKEAVGEIAADTPGVREVRNLITVAS